MKMKEKLKTELQRLGLMPIEEEFGIVFKYQMLNYIFFDSSEDDDYLNICVPYVFEVDEDNILRVFAAVNNCNKILKVVKVVVNDDHVWACYEAKLPKDISLEDVLIYAVHSLFVAHLEFVEQYEKLLLPEDDDLAEAATLCS